MELQHFHCTNFLLIIMKHFNTKLILWRSSYVVKHLNMKEFCSSFCHDFNQMDHGVWMWCVFIVIFFSSRWYNYDPRLSCILSIHILVSIYSYGRLYYKVLLNIALQYTVCVTRIKPAINSSTNVFGHTNVSVFLCTYV